MKYSKGPWSKDADNFIWSTEVTDYEVCHVPRDADASLIAAAPDLLEASQNLLDKLQGPLNLVPDAMELLANAIKKAGKQK